VTRPIEAIRQRCYITLQHARRALRAADAAIIEFATIAKLMRTSNAGPDLQVLNRVPVDGLRAYTPVAL